MIKTWEEARAEGRAEGRNEVINEERAETQANAVLIVLRVRGLAVPDAARQRILGQKDLQLLERWLEKATVATSLEDVLDEPS
jgi:hypothetical protein